MTDPFSIATGCIALVGTITKVSISVTSFVKSFRAARSELDAVSRELSSLRTILELIADDASIIAFPDSLQKQIEGIVSNCSKVLEEIQHTLDKYDNLGNRKAGEWALSGSADVIKLRLSLVAHQTALELALDMVQISISRDIKSDTSVLRDDTSAIRHDTAQILAQISRLRAQLPYDAKDIGQNVVLERYLADMTTYAESVSYGERDQEAPEDVIDHDKGDGSRSRRRFSMASIKRSLSRDRNSNRKADDVETVWQTTGDKSDEELSTSISTIDSGGTLNKKQSMTFRKRSSSLSRSSGIADERPTPIGSAENVSAVQTLPKVTKPGKATSRKSLLASFFAWRSTPQMMEVPASSIFKSKDAVIVSTAKRPSNSSIASNSQDAITGVTSARKRSDSANPPFQEQKTGMVRTQRASIRTKTGEWELGKTIGRGSLSKVVMGSKVDENEVVAVKIIKRSKSSAQAQESALGENPDKRAARAAATLTLLRHPYICSLRDVVRTEARWYLLLEYIDGKSMFDEIVSHGRLSPTLARKYSRQIASALDYCHKNRIVHRDMKVESVLITKAGDIKLIDFMLSNSFSPTGVLDTWCGSLYFAAPELLQQETYIGPEVDIYSFGVLIYTMVCGRVPFDDGNIFKLREMIKETAVEFPSWVKKDCCELINRMMEKKPTKRASMEEVMNHPWMVEGTSDPLENYLPARSQLTLPLDMEIIKRMSGFDFGTPIEIHDKIKAALSPESRATTPRTPNHAPGLSLRKMGSHSSLRKGAELADAASFTVSSKGDAEAMIAIYHLVSEKMQREGRSDQTLPPQTNRTQAQTSDQSMEASSIQTLGQLRPASMQAQRRARREQKALEAGEDIPPLDTTKTDVSTTSWVSSQDSKPAAATSKAAKIFRRLSTRRRS